VLDVRDVGSSDVEFCHVSGRSVCSWIR